MSGYTSPYHIQDKSGKYAFWATCDSKPGGTPGLSDSSHLNCANTSCFCWCTRFGTGGGKFYRWILWRVWIWAFECSISEHRKPFGERCFTICWDIYKQWIQWIFGPGNVFYPTIDLLFGDGLHHPIWVLLVVVHDWDHHMKWYDFMPGTLNFRLGHIEVILCKPWSSPPNHAPTN